MSIIRGKTRWRGVLSGSVRFVLRQRTPPATAGGTDRCGLPPRTPPATPTTPASQSLGHPSSGRRGAAGTDMRGILQRIFALTLCGLLQFGILQPAALVYGQASRVSSKAVPAARISKVDDAFLEDLSRRSFQYLWEHSDPQTGLTLDRAKTDGTTKPVPEGYTVASSAATGFALTGLCIAADRNWVKRKDAMERARTHCDFMPTARRIKRVGSIIL